MEQSKKYPVLGEVDAYPIPEYMVPRMVKDFGYTQEQAEFLVREAKRMLYLCSISDQAIAPSNRVDDGWHTMLMFTRFYRDFAAFIGGFIHHDPTPPGFWEKKQQEGKVKLASGGTPTYVKTKENYKKYFHEDPDPWAWP